MMPVEMDRIYKNIPLEEILWNIQTPPDALVELVDSGKVKPCKTIDLGGKPIGETKLLVTQRTIFIVQLI